MGTDIVDTMYLDYSKDRQNRSPEHFYIKVPQELAAGGHVLVVEHEDLE